jgi:cytosine/adenosine deaminase-related metal-dependent hydrolase
VRRLAAPPPPIPEQIARALAIRSALRSEGLSDWVTFQWGPTGVQWCSQELLASVARESEASGDPVHMHLLETRYQREWADRAYPQGIIRYLDGLGLLTERLTLAHCTWARPDELDLLAARGVTVAINTSSNLLLKSGIAPVQAMLEAGCRIAVGLDGMAFDEDDDALREMRLAGALHRGWGYEQRLGDALLWQMSSANGRRAVFGPIRAASLPGGRIAPGMAADLLVLERDALDERLLGLETDPTGAVFARASAFHIRDVIARGRILVSGGRVLGVDESRLVSELRSAVASAVARDLHWPAWRSTLLALGEDLAPFFRSGRYLSCCG